MKGTITSRITRPGVGGSAFEFDYLIVNTIKGDVLILEADFPRDARAVGTEVWLDYCSVSNGAQYIPRKLRSLRVRDTVKL